MAKMLSDIDWKTLVQALPCIITQLDIDFHVIQQVNAMGTPIETDSGVRFLQDVVRDDEIIPHLQLVKSTGSKCVFETSIIDDGNERVWYEHHVNILNNSEHIIILSTDITARKAQDAENKKILRRYEAIFNNASDSIAVTTWGTSYDESEVSTVNKRLEEMMGFTFDQIKLRRASHFLTPEQRAKAFERRRQREQGADNVEFVEVNVIHRDGSILNLEGLNILIRDESNKIIEAISMMRDVTDRVEQQEELLKAKIAADSALRLHMIFLANMNNELHTPLHNIYGYVEFLIDHRSFSAEVTKILHTIKANADQLTQHINDVLQLSSLKTDNNLVEPRIFSFHKLLDQLHRTVKMQATQKNLELLFDVPPDIPLLIRMDDIMLKQILINLIDNAIKYTDNGHVIVQATLTDKNAICVEIIDTGRGIPSDIIDQISQPFAHGEDIEDIPDIGLGLLIGQRLVEALEGTIDITSQLGQGTHITIILPFEAITTATDRIQTIPEIQVGENHTIMIIDADVESRYLTETYLKNCGFQVYALPPNSNFLEKIATVSPELILFDTSTHTDIIRQTRAYEQQKQITPVIIVGLTPNTLSEFQQELLEAGCNEVIHKPIYLNLLTQRLAKLLNIPTDQLTKSKTEYKDKKLTELTTHMLEPIPQDWLTQMYSICMSGRTEKALQHIDQIESEYPEVARSLQSYVALYRTSHIVNLIEPLLKQK